MHVGMVGQENIKRKWKKSDFDGKGVFWFLRCENSENSVEMRGLPLRDKTWQ